MGKGTIISGGTAGQYQVELALKRDRIQARVAAMTAQIAKIDARIAASTNDHEISILTLQKTALQKRIIYLNNQPSDPTVSAWCADLTEDLTGEVGTIEVPGERGEVNIQPGHGGNAAYDQARDGQLGLNWNLGPAGAAYNLAMLPGWQKWKPTYRYGTITALDGDTCDVSLEVAGSSQFGLNVNQSQTLTGVTIEYMNCNGAAFEVGDEVLVKFEGQYFASPKVIGFKTDPQPCGEYVYILLSMTGKTSRCMVWDIGTGAAAIEIPLNGGGFAVFPCDPATISEWHDALVDSGADLYAGHNDLSLVAQTGEADDPGYPWACTPPTDCCLGWWETGTCSGGDSAASANVGIDGGAVQNIYAFSMVRSCVTCSPDPHGTGVDEMAMTNQAKKAVLGFASWNHGLMGSWKLTIQNMVATPETCLRTKKNQSWDKTYSCYESNADAIESLETHLAAYTIVTPIGEMDPIEFAKSISWEGWVEATSEQLVKTIGSPYVPQESKVFEAKFSDRTIVQLMFYECIRTTRTQAYAASYCLGEAWGDPTWTESGYERVARVAAQADGLDDTAEVDPRTLTRNAELEAVVLGLVTAFYSANSAGAYDIWQFDVTCEILQ